MGCQICGGISGTLSQVRRIVRNQIIIENCEYTQDILTQWLDLFICVKSKNLFEIFHISAPKVNSYLGIIQSSINYSTNPCYFKIRLDEINPIAIQIQNSEQC